jgi:segregation and condensation protein B
MTDEAAIAFAAGAPVGPSPESPAAPADAAVEALLFASDGPLTAVRLAQLTGRARAEVLAAVDHLNVFYAETGRAFRIAPLAGGFQLVTTPEHAPLVSALYKEKTAARLSRAALETLAIIAFKQPVTRAEIDVIRGVSASDGVLRHLMERSLVRIAGRAEAPGRPLLYGTTREFLAHFGLHAIADLPRSDELAALLAGDSRTIPVETEDEPASPELAPAAPVRPSWEDEDDEDEHERSHSVEESDAHVGDSPSQ